MRWFCISGWNRNVTAPLQCADEFINVPAIQRSNTGKNELERGSRSGLEYSSPVSRDCAAPLPPLVQEATQ
jgi:hypothetical protein